MQFTIDSEQVLAGMLQHPVVTQGLMPAIEARNPATLQALIELLEAWESELGQLQRLGRGVANLLEHAEVAAPGWEAKHEQHRHIGAITNALMDVAVAIDHVTAAHTTLGLLNQADTAAADALLALR